MNQFRSFTTAAIFGDHMVLQRGKPVKIWGENTVHQFIRVFVDGQEAGRTQAAPGAWAVTLPALPTSWGMELTIAGEDPAETLTFRDVALGEVWIAGGQSNMEFALEFDAEAHVAIPRAHHPGIRFFDCPKVKYPGYEAKTDLSQFGFWRPCTPVNAPFYSAVGYYFARQIEQHCQAPVGIIGCNWGGTSASAWMDESLLQQDELLSVYCAEYEQALERLDMQAYLAAEEKQRQLWNLPQVQKSMRNMMKRTPGPLTYPLFTAGMRLVTKSALPLGPHSENRPGGLFHTMLQKIAGYTARGVIWYQGESDHPKAGLYARLFGAMIACWRQAWQDDLPFLFVQLAPHASHLGLPVFHFADLRQQQEQVAQTTPAAYMASIMDLGAKLDIHPKLKRPVGERLALLARGKVYGEDLLCEAPEVAEMQVAGDCLTITFRHAGEGLYLKGRRLKSLELVVDGAPCKAQAVIVDKERVLVQAAALLGAICVEARLAHADFAEVNLYNSAGLPAKPFCRSWRRPEAAIS